MKTSLNLKNLILSSVIVLGGVIAEAQSLRIVYDFNKDQVSYYKTKPGDKIGKEIASPVVGRNRMVHVEVINFNKFVYTANSTFVSSEVVEDSDISFMSIITPLVMPGASGNFFTTLGGKMPDEVPRGGLLSMEDANDAFEDLSLAYKEFSVIGANMQNMDYAIQKLNSLKYNPYLPTDTIVRMADQIIEMIFKKPTVSPSDFTNKIMALNDQYSAAKSSLSAASTRFYSEYNAFANDAEGAFVGQGLDDDVRKANLALVGPGSAINPESLVKRIDLLETLYTSIKATSFSFNSSHSAKDDAIALSLSFYQNPTSDSGTIAMANMDNLSSLNKVKDKKIDIVVRGDVKMTTSVGVGMPFFSTNQEFINKDSVITSQSAGAYSPNLAGYVNFYRYTGRLVNVGGTFGIGVPLNDKSRTVNMFLGASSLFGSDSRVGLHGGLTFGQVKQLDEGYIVGDALLSATQEVPLRNNWEVGGFFGISFSLAKSNSGQ